MYKPIKDGLPKNEKQVSYKEIQPDENLSAFVDCFWELKTKETLSDECVMHAIPDACVNILLNQHDTSIAGITALQTTFQELNLGKDFHYVGVQLHPGVWRGNNDEITNEYVGTPYEGELPLCKVSEEIANMSFEDKILPLQDMVQKLIDEGTIAHHTIIGNIMRNLKDIENISDMAHVAGLSPRQLQRILKRDILFSPHDFLKVLRLQQTFTRSYLISYTDQSHFIHSFKKITGHTPTEYMNKFDV